LLQGRICDIDLTNPAGIFGISWTHFSYVVPLTDLLIWVLWFYCPQILKKQGVLQVESEGGGH
jgi:FHS family L-fucose permease-like MFS transporter